MTVHLFTGRLKQVSHDTDTKMRLFKKQTFKRTNIQIRVAGSLHTCRLIAVKYFRKPLPSRSERRLLIPRCLQLLAPQAIFKDYLNVAAVEGR